ncbi:poly(beta-D-mannuronate) lyase [Lutibacter agarilyticus]|uniref:Poly(Beta-D-mannuronate) lyase n=1 Tax=Lutibacter agarilyticus TaxID=1109740 RepID=A0A238YS56_9FLAO|nr:polysaccharide lyase 6 family protein [Lutibacter agarilyticus]SNR73658.1 poly(beta-D-mannuronate) lyase [Lutibacter agarilyticus]
MTNKKFTLLVLFLLFQILVTAQATSTTVSNIIEFDAAIKKAVPGSKIILKNGIWKDVHLKANGIGTKEAPILITAETDGEVIITGDSRLNISGKYVIIKGLWFKDGTPTTKYLVEFRKDSKDFAYNCRLTNCTVSYYNPSDPSIESHWIDLWGKNNRVDHNNFTGKENGGTTLVVWLKGQEHTENNHRIDHNFFGNRPELGANGGETIRIGTSTNSLKSSKTLVEYNTFKHCNGEIEIISNKSCDNIFRNNLFLESEGTLTLRHGNNALVENNVFIGNNLQKAGGIRVINAGHTIQNNLLINVVGDDYRGPIVVMNGVPNSPLNRYNQVKNVTIQNNTLINCSAVQFGAGKDDEKTLPAINTIFANNLITNTNGGQIINEQDEIKGIQFFGNIVDSEATVNPNLFTKATIDWQVLKNLPMPSATNELLKTAKKTAKSPKFDMANSKRETFVAGAFNLNNTVYPSVLLARTGPFWNPIIEERKPSVVENTNIFVEPGTETISKALKKAGLKGTLILSPGTYTLEKTMKISGEITIKGDNEKGEIIIKSADDLQKSLTYLFRVNEGATAKLENLTLDGESSSTTIKYAVVSPDKNLAGKYNLYVNNCTFQNFSNKDGGAVFKAYVGTLADTISIKNSIIQDSYRGLNLSYEKGPYGKYNAETIVLYNSVFKNIEEFAVNYIRSGINPVTKGGELIVDQCVFSKVYNTEKGYILKTKAINFVTIKNTVFENSYKVITPVSLSGSNNSIDNSLVFNSGSIKVTNKAKKGTVTYKNPKWEDHQLFLPSPKSHLLKENNKVGRIGLITPLKN